MKVILFGATGMIGSGSLKECLSDSRVSSVLVIGRSTCGVKHYKIREIIHSDFFDYSSIRDELAGYDACFFCLGVSSAGKNEAQYHRMTYEITVAAADTLSALNPDMTFCYVSGAGADSSEEGSLMWARVRGKTENQLQRLPFKAAYIFRPAYVQPTKGVQSKTPLYQVFYTLAGPFYPVLKRLFPKYVSTTEDLGRAMIRAAEAGYTRRLVESHDINALASLGRRLDG